MRLSFCIWIVCLLAGNAKAQPLLHGVIRDAETEIPLPFASIQVVGRNVGTVSNAEGVFYLSLNSLENSDLISVSYMGYETHKQALASLSNPVVITLKPAIIQLNAVKVTDQILTPEEILKRVRKNYPINHPADPIRQEVFYHKYERTPFPESNRVTVKSSNFDGLDKSTFEELFALLPREFIEYRDATLTLYQHEEQIKLDPISGISLEEGTMQNLVKVIESKLAPFLQDVQATDAADDLYYQFRSGIFRYRTDPKTSTDSIAIVGGDSLHYVVNTKLVASELAFLIREYTLLSSQNWEFITHPSRYRYQKDKMTVLQDELVHVIRFFPERGGLFTGTAYISAITYAILQLDFAYEPEKDDKQISLLGLSHAMHDKQGRVIFEKGEGGYFLKYVKAYQQEFGAIQRDITIQKNQKRFWLDKELNKLKFSVDVAFDTHTDWELLIVNREPISESVYADFSPPATIKYKKEYAFSPEQWKQTTLAPVAELRQFN